MTLIAWGLLLSFVGAIVVAMTSLELRGGDYLGHVGPRDVRVQTWGGRIGWALLALGFGLQLLGEVLP